MIKWNKQFEYPASMRTSIEGKRHYEITGSHLPSVTTILSATETAEKQASLAKWREKVGMDTAARITEQSAARGTTMHAILEDALEGKNRVDMTENGVLATRMAQQIIDNAFPKMDEIWGSEVTVYYPGLYAGATDIVGIYNGVESIMDFKQSNKPKRREWLGDYKLQLAAYAMAHNQIYGTNIKQGVNLICTKECLFQEFIFDEEEMKQGCLEFIKRTAQYYAQLTAKTKENKEE
jgi:genome maintenance exonuclease 1